MSPKQLRELKQRLTKRQLWELYREHCLDLVCRMQEIVLFPKQEAILTDPHKIKVFRSARRTGKSLTAAIKAETVLVFGAIFDYPTHQIIGGPRTEDTRHIWEYLDAFWEKAPLSSILPIELTYSNRKSHSTTKWKWMFGADTWIRTGGCQDPNMDDWRGDWLDNAIIDEFGQVPYKESFLEAVLYALKDEGQINEMSIIGTHDPVGMGEEFNRIYELGDLPADTENRPNIKSYKLIGADNPYSSEADAQTAKDLVSEAGYLREEMGEAVPPGGKMFGHFDIRFHDKVVEYNPRRPFSIGVDFGFNKPYAVWFQAYHDRWDNGRKPTTKDVRVDVFHEFSPKEIKIDDFVEELKTHNQLVTQGARPTVVGCDKAGNARNSRLTLTDFEELKQEFPEAQFTTNSHLVSKANQVWVYKWLTPDKRIRVSKNCPRALRFFALASPDKSRLGAVNSAGWLKVKGIDDPGDALAYGLINLGITADLITVEKEVVLMDTNMANRIAQQLAEY